MSNNPGPPPLLMHYNMYSSDDEGYANDDDPDVPPALMEPDNVFDTRRPPLTYHRIPQYSRAMAEERAAAAAPAASQPLEDDNNYQGLSLSCGMCSSMDAAPVEMAWVTRRPLPRHPDRIITSKGICRQLGPCLLDSHLWFSSGAEDDAEVEHLEEECNITFIQMRAQVRLLKMLIHQRDSHAAGAAQVAEFRVRIGHARRGLEAACAKYQVAWQLLVDFKGKDYARMRGHLHLGNDGATMLLAELTMGTRKRTEMVMGERGENVESGWSAWSNESL
ncbi:hypothetical protein B0H17DRAFT_1201578 [Mycena rosella]|uniref:Uncharacterized protein n=1 Tax=Mycena rosella TaxID=1033263 RepID=A0AAD7DFX2_MYCRO|nr:hypothetical protein B0H17DRAFT_1201578 [Mycena rosella]